MSEEASPRLVFIAGLSGSGKSTAMAALEDLGFYCVDNLPAQLVPQFVSLCGHALPPIEKIALAVDARESRFLDGFPEVVMGLREEGAPVQVIFLDASDDEIEKRYRETRRIHPLSPGGGVAQGVERERGLLAEAASLADQRIDTSALNVHELKAIVTEYILGEVRPTVINLTSFGFRYGTPQAVELLFDMRFLPNPYFEEKLRPRTGCDPDVASYVIESERGQDFLDHLKKFIAYLLPLYDGEGKAYVTVGIGCTGGRHRSVAIVEALGVWLCEMGREVNTAHRDMERLS